MSRDRFGEALGIWHVTIGGADLELKPPLGYGRKFRNIVMKEEYKKDKVALMSAFEDWMVEVISYSYPNDKESSIEYVDQYCQELFEEALVRLRFTTKEQLERSKKEGLGDIKKLIEES